MSSAMTQTVDDLFAALERRDLASAEELLIRHGLSAAGVFTAACVAPDVASEALLGPQAIRLRARDADLLLVQGLEPAAVLRALSLPADEPAGIGSQRAGVTGAALTIRDARQSWELAVRRNAPVIWEQDWLFAVLGEHTEQVRPMLARAAGLADGRHHLAEAVRAFASASFSSSRAARELFVQPNTVVYRLQQWHRRTGMDPRSWSGLTASLAAIELAALLPSPDAPVDASSQANAS